MEVLVSAPRWRIALDRFARIVKQSTQLDKQMEDVAEDMRRTAEETYRAQEKGTGTGESRQSFVKRLFPGGWAVVLSVDIANLVEAGAHPGGKTFVLGYRPMRAAMDRSEELGSRVNMRPGPIAPISTRA